MKILQTTNKTCKSVPVVLRGYTLVKMMALKG